MGLSPTLSMVAKRSAYAPFTPSHSGQRSPPTSYRGCWHVVSRGFFRRYRPSSSQRKGVYNPRAVIPHAASLRQAFAHCARFLAAASRRSLGRLSVPVWLAILSDQRPVIGLGGSYPPNDLMGPKLALLQLPLLLESIPAPQRTGSSRPFQSGIPQRRIDSFGSPQPSATGDP